MYYIYIYIYTYNIVVTSLKGTIRRMIFYQRCSKFSRKSNILFISLDPEVDASQVILFFAYQVIISFISAG